VAGHEIQITSIQLVGSNVLVSVTTISGKNYVLERNDSVSASSWAAVGPSVPGTGMILQLTDAGGLGPARRFYRVAEVTLLPSNEVSSLIVGLLSRLAQANRNILRLGNHKFFHFHHYRLGTVFRQDHIRNVGDQLLQQLPTASFPVLQQVLNQLIVVDRPLDPITERGAREIKVQIDGDQQPLRLRPLRFRYT